MKRERRATIWRCVAASLLLLLGLSFAWPGPGPASAQPVDSARAYWKSKIGQDCTISYRTESRPGDTTRVGKLKEVQDRWVVIDATEQSLSLGETAGVNQPHFTETRREYCIPIDIIADVTFEIP